MRRRERHGVSPRARLRARASPRPPSPDNISISLMLHAGTQNADDNPCRGNPPSFFTAVHMRPNAALFNILHLYKLSANLPAEIEDATRDPVQKHAADKATANIPSPQERAVQRAMSIREGVLGIILGNARL